MNEVQDKKVQHALLIIKKALEKYNPIAVGCSFGKDSMVALHLARRINPQIPVFFVKTKFMPQETLDFKEKVVDLWNLNLAQFESEEDVASDLPLTDPDECCRILKVEPTKEAVKNLEAWITGVRNTEGITRVSFNEVEFRGLVKINPILEFTEADVWRYIAIHSIPVHPWYSLGYRSLGCACCSVPNTNEERGGRWKGTVKEGGECGIHTYNLKPGEIEMWRDRRK
jgi:phosphoadenosine phosphosulfate reductase